MMSVEFGVRRSKGAGIGGKLREASVSFDGLIVKFAKKLGSEAPVGALA
jgi:hypothetical protein